MMTASMTIQIAIARNTPGRSGFRVEKTFARATSRRDIPAPTPTLQARTVP